MNKLYLYMSRFGEPNSSGNGWYDGLTCPFCGKKKLTFHPEKRIIKCWRGCYKGKATEFIMRRENIMYFEALDYLDREDLKKSINIDGINGYTISEIELPYGYHTILDGKGLMADRARHYLYGRKFNLHYLDNLGIGYCNEKHSEANDDYFGYIIIPFRRNGLLQYFVGRDFIGNYLRYKNPIRDKYGIGKQELFYNEDALDKYSAIWLCEGIFDALTIGKSAVAIQGLSISRYQCDRLIECNAKSIIICMDAGTYRNSREIAKRLVNHKQIKILDLSQFFEPGGKDVNEIGRERVIWLEEATPYTTMESLILH